MLGDVLVFDVETVIDASAVKRFLYQDGEASTLRRRMRDHRLEATDGRSDFVKPPFHQVVAISLLLARPAGEQDDQSLEIQTLTSRSGDADGEAELLAWFLNGFEQLKPQLVSFNGRGFDLPVLKYRAMRHGVRAPLLHDTRNKWENYSVRYAASWHCDLMDVMADYGASTRVGLEEICAVLGLPGKLGLDGGQVESFYEAARLDEIATYCETDVLNTYLVYLAYMRHQGRLSEDGHRGSLGHLASYLETHCSDRAYIDSFRPAVS